MRGATAQQHLQLVVLALISERSPLRDFCNKAWDGVRTDQSWGQLIAGQSYLTTPRLFRHFISRFLIDRQRLSPVYKQG